MPDINITVAHKVAVSDTTTIVCDNSDYMVHWTLDEEWSAYDTKTMRTIYMDGTYEDKVFSGDTIALPVCTVPGVVQIGLFAGDIRTSRVAILRALPSVRSAAGAPANPAPDVYDQLMEIIKGLGGTDPDDIAKAVADYLATHPVEETDPTVPEWAKAETKPTYTSSEVGAISQDDLQSATSSALAQAKASGEFDGSKGDTGPAGPQGPAGAPGKDGAGMDITGATVGQIAKITAVDSDGKPTAWSPVDMPSGGGGEKWEKIAEIELRADTAEYVLADFATWRKAKVIMTRPAYISGLSKNVWCNVVGQNSSDTYSCGYLTLAYGYVFWEFSAEVNDLFVATQTLQNNNTRSAQYVQSSGTFTPLKSPIEKYKFELIFTDTSVIQAGDKVLVIGVRR